MPYIEEIEALGPRYDCGCARWEGSKRCPDCYPCTCQEIRHVDYGLIDVAECDNCLASRSEVRPDGPETAEGGLIGQMPY